MLEANWHFIFFKHKEWTLFVFAKLSDVILLVYGVCLLMVVGGVLWFLLESLKEFQNNFDVSFLEDKLMEPSRLLIDEDVSQL